ncbi:SGNH/GDSL hydrolase family protein [Calidifontibacter sp. DB0510]|uniref:SGNH/GDSL hydrolase family protein n=1 Tax=Metallococcus carri TaxID=1656884 RepID=A0A967B7S1_9MICO|nr:SGNH/GDSL hydrolase family protein [Metallococcus carri]NHN56321.1 SGNH/GDSL hydrolase family protein [Metallococcus carri]NOP38627.1 SGNH/GDSL hydrolase family protein [Calidifontibacter sp. DB2511S]
MDAIVGLGDSYAAGVGSPDPDGLCWRSRSAYPIQVGTALGRDVVLNACLGATIADVLANQLDSLSADTPLVTITVGGNDAGFAQVLTRCALPAWMGDSDDVLDEAAWVIRDVLPERLRSLYAAVRAKAPNARLIVAGYPRLWDRPEDCNLATFFSPHEIGRMNQAADELAIVIGAAARDSGADFLDVRSAFTGQGVCERVEWIRGVSWPVEESFHPAPLGHRAYARAVLDSYGRRETAGIPAKPSVRYGVDCRGSAPTFRLPDLLSGRSLRGAKAHGLDTDEVAALGERVRQPQPDPAAHDRLRELDAQVRATR